LTSRRRGAARGAAHERANCELRDPMASLRRCRQFFPNRYRVVVRRAPSAAMVLADLSAANYSLRLSRPPAASAVVNQL
jgi:hypothetical protein